MKTIRTTATAASAASLALLLAASPVAAQMFERAYSFQARDRASLAVIMMQAENGMFEPQQQSSGTTAATSPLQYTVNNLICSGDSGSANTDANSSCIILNNADAAIGTDQDSIGDQGATSDVSTTTNNMSDALAGTQ